MTLTDTNERQILYEKDLKRHKPVLNIKIVKPNHDI
jgi:hypothetical protein